MRRDLSIVTTDKRHYRVIAQEHWGLTDEQMVGMHVHHRTPRCKGGTNDPSNLYVCSPSFHKHAWHDGKEWVDWAHEGARAGVAARSLKRKNDPDWAEQESRINRLNAQKQHQQDKGKPEYHEKQSRRALKAVCSKRKHWGEATYLQVETLYYSGHTSGYKIARQLGFQKWKSISNMLECISLGLTFEQATVTENYVQESHRIKNSPVFELISSY